MLNKNYLKYLFQNKKIAWIFFLVMYMAISLSSFISFSNTYSSKLSFTFKCCFVLSILMTFVLPVFLFSFVHRKRSCDLYFSLPIKRKELVTSTILFSFLIIFGYFLITTLVGCLLSFTHTSINLTVYLQTILFVGFGTFILLLINSSIYLLGNNIFDGIVMLFAYTFIPISIMICTEIISNLFLVDFLVSKLQGGIYFSPVAMVFVNGHSILHNITQINDYLMEYQSMFSIVYLFLLAFYAGVACYLLKKHFIDRKIERAEQISDSFLSYPFIINYYLLISLIILGFTCVNEGISETYIFLYLLLYFVYIVALFIYKRKIKFYWKNTLYYVIVMFLSIGIGKVIYLNEGFGLPYTYSFTNGDKLVCNLSEYNLTRDLTFDSEGTSSTSISLDITTNIPTSKLESDQYSKAFSILKKTRDDAIEAWFHHSSDYYETASCSISFTNMNLTDTLTYSPTYQTSNLLTLDELKELDKCSMITIQVYDYEKGIEKSYSLSEYLRAVKNDFE